MSNLTESIAAGEGKVKRAESPTRDVSTTSIHSSASVQQPDDEKIPIFRRQVAADGTSIEAGEDASLLRLTLTRGVHDTLNLGLDLRESDPEGAELQFSECRRLLEKLWDIAEFQQDEFCDLLAACETALRHEKLLTIGRETLAPLQTAVSLLMLPFQEPDDVTEIVDSLALIGFNMLAPVTHRDGEVFNVTVSRDPA